MSAKCRQIINANNCVLIRLVLIAQMVLYWIPTREAVGKDYTPVQQLSCVSSLNMQQCLLIVLHNLIKLY